MPPYLPPPLSFFTKAFSAFQTSASPFIVICSLPPVLHHDIAESPTTHPPLTQPHPPPSPPQTLIVLDSSFNPPTLAHMHMARTAILRGAPSHSGQELGTPQRILLLLSINNADKALKPAAFEHRLMMIWLFGRDLQDNIFGISASRAAAVAATMATAATNSITSNNNIGTHKEDNRGNIIVDLGLTRNPYFHTKAKAISQSLFYTAPGSSSTTQPEQVYLAGFDTLIRIFNPKYYPPPSLSPSISAGTTAAPPMQTSLTPFFTISRLLITSRPDPSSPYPTISSQRAYLVRLASSADLEDVGGLKEWVDRVDLVEGRKEDEEALSSTRVREVCSKGDRETLRRLVSPRVEDWIVGEGLYGFDCSS